MTTAQLNLEWYYRLEERLAILCQDQAPTGEQVMLARAEADRWEDEQWLGHRK